MINPSSSIDTYYANYLTSQEEAPDSSLTTERIKRIKHLIPKTPMLDRFVAHTGLTAVNGNTKIVPAFLSTQYNLKLGKPTDQKNSGRCWIFAALNMLRMGKEVTFSENYVSFWDKFERANYFLEKMIEMKDLSPMDQRLLNCIEHLYKEGGEWELFFNIVEKYGLVPNYAMKETNFSGNSSGYIAILQSRLREVGGLLHKKAKEGACQSELQRLKDIALGGVYNILSKYLGAPPKRFQSKGKNGEIIDVTPLEFYKNCSFNLKNYIEVADFPYCKQNTLIRVKDVSNMVQAQELHGINSGLEIMKKAVRESIKDGVPVLFNSETEHLDKNTNVFSMDNDQRDVLFGLDPSLTLSKGDRLKYRVTTVAHAMIFVGCDDPGESKYKGNKPSKVPEAHREPLWKVENSWERASTIYMTDSWFDAYVYSIIVDKKYLPKEYLATLDSKEVLLDAWDPYGRI